MIHRIKKPVSKNPGLLALTLLTVTILILLFTNLVNGQPSADSYQYFPLSAKGGLKPLCRFGVNDSISVLAFDAAKLRLGWYVNYKSSPSIYIRNGAKFTPIVALMQTGTNEYDYKPKGSALNSAISMNPGADWLIGNEPDRIKFQDDIEPHLYARVYHELYNLIKAADPSAKIFAGNIVQPTDIRLKYLDLVLDSYQSEFGQQMPVDGWSIHNFILNEVSCNFDPTNCWGAEIPPGVDDDFGEILEIEDNDDFDRFKERILKFRQWMTDRGYDGLPLYISEYGILMPQDFGFPPERVNAFMTNTFNYILNQTDLQLGNPEDGYRLVQKLSWYSSFDLSFNGWLFDRTGPGSPNTIINSIGQNYADYVARLENEVDYYPSQFSTNPQSPAADGGNVNVSIQAKIADQGNQAIANAPVRVQFFDDHPDSGGKQIGTDQSVSIAGCGSTSTVEVLWEDLAAGQHTYYAQVDGNNSLEETDESNNIGVFTFVISD